MRQMSALIFDSRYSVPTLRLELFPSADPHTLALGLLRESPFYQAVELHLEDQLLVRVDTADVDADREAHA